MTDHEHAQAVKDAVAALNKAVTSATASGLAVNISTIEHHTTACGFSRTDTVFAEVVRPL